MSKKWVGWRTMLVVPELQTELVLQRKYAQVQVTGAAFSPVLSLTLLGGIAIQRASLKSQTEGEKICMRQCAGRNKFTSVQVKARTFQETGCSWQPSQSRYIQCLVWNHCLKVLIVKASRGKVVGR